MIPQLNPYKVVYQTPLTETFIGKSRFILESNCYSLILLWFVYFLQSFWVPFICITNL